jgi:hypothetical protein
MGLELGRERTLREQAESRLQEVTLASQGRIEELSSTLQTRILELEQRLAELTDQEQAALEARQRLAECEIRLARYREAYGDLKRRKRRDRHRSWWPGSR